METAIRLISLDQIDESPWNPRKIFRNLDELAGDLKRRGVLQPILVREREGRFELVFGARRLRAARMAGLADIPAMVREMSDQDVLETQIVENANRDDVHPLEEAAGYRLLLERTSHDVEAIAAKVGKSTSHVYQRLKLLDLIKPAQDAFLADAITPGHAVQIARLQPPDQKRALEHCFEERWIHASNRRERTLVSVRQLAGFIEQEIHLDLNAAPFAKDDPALVEEAGSCNTCPKRTGFSPALFPDIKRKDTCTDGTCFHAKLDAHLERQKTALQEKEGAKVLELSSEYHPESGGRSKKEAAALKGVIFGKDYEEAAAKGARSCEFARHGLVTHGARDVGKLKLVCTEKSCKVHHRAGGDDSYSRAATARAKAGQRKAKIENETNRRVLLAVRDKLTGKLDAATLKSIATVAYERLTHDAMKHVCGLYEWKGEKRQYGSPDFRAAGRRALAKLSALETTKFLIILTFIGEYHPFSTESAKRLHAAARSYRVDVKGIAKEVAAKMAPKTKGKPKGKATAVKKSAATRKAAKPKATKPLHSSAKSTAAEASV